jgi:F-type H+-transporting ATPase subunit beta
LTDHDAQIGPAAGPGGGVADIRYGGILQVIARRLVTLNEPEIVIEVASLPGGCPACGVVMTSTCELRLPHSA